VYESIVAIIRAILESSECLRLAQHAGIKKKGWSCSVDGRRVALMRHDFLYDINRPIKLNHNLANQNWNKMTGGGRRINSRRPAEAKACWDSFLAGSSKQPAKDRCRKRKGSMSLSRNLSSPIRASTACTNLSVGLSCSPSDEALTTRKSLLL
jgi:hypothetical protein